MDRDVGREWEMHGGEDTEAKDKEGERGSQDRICELQEGRLALDEKMFMYENLFSLNKTCSETSITFVMIGIAYKHTLLSMKIKFMSLSWY